MKRKKVVAALLLHRLAKRDEVTGHWGTRCGKQGLEDPRVLPYVKGSKMALIVSGARTFIAQDQDHVTCSRCKGKGIRR